MSLKIDLACFSYLASAKVLRIDKYPQKNYGAEINGFIDTIAPDAPIVAIAASRLGLRTGFIGNDIGMDGEKILKLLSENGVEKSPVTNEKIQTPFIMVVSDSEGNREWFAYISSALNSLLHADLSLIKSSSLAYVDIYEVIQKASLKAIHYAHKHQVPLFLNLGGSALTTDLIVELQKKSISICQTNLSESEVDNAKDFVKHIYNTVRPEIAIVTLGAKGAIAYSKSLYFQSNAYQVNVFHLHGAGAAFSAGYAYAYLKKWSIESSLDFACALGSLNCASGQAFNTFSYKKTQKFMRSKRLLLRREL